MRKLAVLITVLCFAAPPQIAQAQEVRIIGGFFVEYRAACGWGVTISAESNHPFPSVDLGPGSSNVYGIHHLYAAGHFGKQLFLALDPSATVSNVKIQDTLPSRGGGVYKRTWQVLADDLAVVNGVVTEICPLFVPGLPAEIHIQDSAGGDSGLYHTQPCTTDGRVTHCKFP
jgi:hypothetical protein